ncbi:MAG TPA: 4Fe-4S dicluster domain-containing protein, partial [Thermoplasmata archaeon]|nr:4Fe-4S dicluster domain-containing protein [Thermoplasmata archaeon]
ATGVWHVSVAGADPAYFLYSFYFGVLWFVMFVTIPYTGTYNCVTMGWCHWGTFSQAFSRLGFFRLKVHSPKLCRECTTLDCAKACPVGLVDMPGHFRTTGTFRSSKCCGVGECAGACPYGNLYLSDVRHWIRAALGRERPVLPELLLPMARTASTGSAAGGPATLAAPRSREA